LVLVAWAPAQAEESPEGSPYGGSLWSRSTLSGNWGGVRDQWAARGFTVDFDATDTFQGVVSGGLDGALFEQFSDEDDTGNDVSGNFALELDTGKAGLWQGGLFNARLEGRAGRSVLQRTGSVSAVDNDALFPNVVDRFDEEALAITELTFTQSLGEKVALFGGLLNTAEGDANELAGSAPSNEHFLNSALLYSLVEDATVPNVSLGGGISYTPNEHVSGSFSVFGTSETAGEDPFDQWHGTTFATEWVVAHRLTERSGAQTFGTLYGIDARRTDIAADPRSVVGGILRGEPVPTTRADTWALYYNAHQFIHGDRDEGWGIFVRVGLSDGNPNLVKWNAAGGMGGTGLLPGRSHDRWGLGVFSLGMSDQDLLQGLGIDDEIGGELFYNVAVTPWLHVTLDAQVIDSALPPADTAWVLGLRTHFDL
jgi:porin